jgi:hypothetical protein
MQITVEIKSVFGNSTIYPACDKARLFAALAGTTTLTQNALRQIKSLGYTIDVKQATLSI